MLPADTITTVDLNGLSVSTPIPVSGAASESCYYEVIKQVSPSPLISQLPAPEFLPIDLLPTEQWLLKKPAARRPKTEPSARNAAKVNFVEKIWVTAVEPLSWAATALLSPPYELAPHVTTAPSSLMTAKA
jgi:hypothetical protein